MNSKQVILIIATFVLTGLYSCRSKTGEDKIPAEIINNPATANGNAETGDLPVFEFETTNHEFGEIKQGDVVNFTFNFTNTGKKDLFIISAKASCGCTIPSYSKEAVHPGEKGKLDVSFDSNGKTGMVSKTITVIANTIPNTRVLTISADISTGK